MNVPKLRFKEFNDEWKKIKLSDISNITMGQSPDSNNYTTNKNDMILIQGNADLNNGIVLPRIFTTQVTKQCYIGDIIMTVRAPVGDVAISNYNACIGRGVCAIKGSKFIYHYLKYLKGKEYWKKISKGSTIDSITSNDIKELEVKIPLASEENKIIKFMDLLDKKIELQSKKIEALKLYKKCSTNILFLSAKSRIYLKDLVKCKNSVISLSDIELDNGKYPIYGANGIIKYISSFDFTVNYIGIIKDGAGVGKTMVCKSNSSILSTMNALIPIKRENIFYINDLINQINFNKYIVGSGIPHIYFKDYCNAQISVHEPENRLKIGKFIENIEQKIKLENNKLTKLDLLKKGLIHNMFV